MAVDFVQRPDVAPVEERPVFAARSLRRPRILRLGGRALAVLTALWLAGLVIGGFGFGYLPGLRFPGSHKASSKETARPVSGSVHSKPAPGIAAAPHRSAARGGRGSAAPQTRVTRGHARGRGQARLTSRGSHAGSVGLSTIVPGATRSGSNVNSRGRTLRSSSPGSRSQAPTSPGRTHSESTPSAGSGSAGTATTQGNDHSIKK